MPTTLTSKGQVTIPKQVRDALGLKRGMQVEFILEDGRAILEPLRKGGADALRGSLKEYGLGRRKPGDKEVMEKVKRKVAEDAAREGRSSGHQRHSKVPSRR